MRKDQQGSRPHWINRGRSGRTRGTTPSQVVAVWNDAVINSPHVSIAIDGKMTSSGTVLGYDKSPEMAYKTAMRHAESYSEAEILACVKDGGHYLNITPEGDQYVLTHCVFDVLAMLKHGSGQIIMRGSFVELLKWSLAEEPRGCGWTA